MRSAWRNSKVGNYKSLALEPAPLLVDTGGWPPPSSPHGILFTSWPVGISRYRRVEVGSGSGK